MFDFLNKWSLHIINQVIIYIFPGFLVISWNPGSDWKHENISRMMIIKGAL